MISSTKAGSGSTIMPRIMNISKRAGETMACAAFIALNPRNTSARLCDRIHGCYDILVCHSNYCPGSSSAGPAEHPAFAGPPCDLLPDSAGFAIAAKLVDIGQHFCYGVIKRLRNFIPQFGMVVKRAGKRRRLEHRHLMLSADFTDFQGKKMRALSQLRVGARILPSSYLSAIE